jgi:subtilisin family serine protease
MKKRGLLTNRTAAVRGAGAAMVAAVALLGSSDAFAASPHGDDRRPDATHIIILRDGASADRVAREHGLAVSSKYERVFNGIAAVVPPGRLGLLAADNDVLAIEENVTVRTLGRPDVSPLGSPAVGATAAQQVPAGVKRVGAHLNAEANIDGVDDRVPVVVAVIDTGVDGSHPDLNVNVARSANCVGSSVCATGVAVDANSHGTHVAGTIAALDNGFGVVGVAPGAEIWSLRVCGADGSCKTDAIIRAHEYVSANAGLVSVVNLSLGGTGASEAWRRAIEGNVNRGVTVVVAAGNDSREIYGGDGTLGNSNDFVPAAFKETMAVSAMSDSDGVSGGAGTTADDTLTSFSNYSVTVVSTNPVSSPGAAVDVAAPGVSVLSTMPGNSYGRMSGTSMASPHAAGVVALYVAAHGKPADAAGVAGVRQALISGGEPMNSWRPDNKDVNSDQDTNHEPLITALAGVVPELDVAVARVSAPSEVLKGTTVEVQAVVSNVGGVALAEPLSVDLTTDNGTPFDTSDDSVVGSGVVAGGLQPGQSSTVRIGWDTATAAAGAHALKARHSLADSDVRNDAAGATAVVSETAPAPGGLAVSIGGAKTAYASRDTVSLTANVVLSDGRPAAGAAVSFKLTGANGWSQTVAATADGNGVARFSHKLNTKRSGCGVYSVTADASLPGYEAAAASVTFNVCQ